MPTLLPSSSSSLVDGGKDDNDERRIDVLLFDLDGTLYDHACGYEEEVHSNIFKFMVQTTGSKFDAISTLEEAQTAWRPIFDKYNLTKRGLLEEGYRFDGREYDKFIRQGAGKYIQKDESLRAFLQSFPSRLKKVIFTNAPESSATEILDLLGVRDLFHDVMGTDFLENRVCKPEKQAFTKVLNYLGLQESPTECRRVCYFEDSFKNLQAGKDLGFMTVFIDSETLINEGKSAYHLKRAGFDAILERKLDMTLKSKLPLLWDE